MKLYPTATPGYIKDQFGLRHDRGGSFTTTWGSTASEFGDTATRLGFGRYFGTPGRPQSASVHMERFWLSMRSAVDPTMLETGLTEYKFDAMVMAGDVHNRSPTASNLLGAGEPPL